MPGARAATQSRRCGSSPKAPSGDSATMRDTSLSSTKTSNGKRTLSCMSNRGVGACVGLFVAFRFRVRLRDRLWLRLGLVDRSDHVKRALRDVVELVVQNPLAAIQCVLEADELAGEAGELLRGKEWLCQEAFEPAS